MEGKQKEDHQPFFYKSLTKGGLRHNLKIFNKNSELNGQSFTAGDTFNYYLFFRLFYHLEFFRAAQRTNRTRS